MTYTKAYIKYEDFKEEFQQLQGQIHVEEIIVVLNIISRMVSLQIR